MNSKKKKAMDVNTNILGRGQQHSKAKKAKLMKERNVSTTRSKDTKPMIVARNRQTTPEAAKVLAKLPKAFLLETKSPLT